MAEEPIEIQNNEAEHRFEVLLGDSRAVLKYERDGDRIALIHTEVPAALEGRGVAGRLAVAALEDARARNLAVVPRCEFVSAYIKRHPDYLPTVDPAHRAGLE